MVATSESYFLFYLGKKGINGLELGLISTFPIFLASLVLLNLPRFKILMKIESGLIISLGTQVIGLILLWSYVNHSLPLYITLIGLSAYWIGGQVSGPLWLDFMAGHSVPQFFGKSLSRRNTFVTFSTLIFFLLLSYWVKKLESFSTLFLIGLISRFLSMILNLFLVKKFPPREKDIVEQENHEEAENILKTFNFWGAIFRFTVAVSSPFFLVYMLKDLKLSAPSYVWLSGVPLLTRAIFQQNWARASAQGRAFYGFQISTIFISTLPILWTISNHYYYLISLQLLSGLFWGGVELTQILMIQNYFHGNSRKIIAKQQAMYGFAAMLGGVFGGYLLDKGFNIFEIFNLSSGLRFLVASVIIYKVRSFKLAKLSLSTTTQYLNTLLSIRGSLALVIRAIPIKKK